MAVLLRPDASIAAVQTDLGFVVTYTLTFDAAARVCRQIPVDTRAHRLSLSGHGAAANAARVFADAEAHGHRSVTLRFCMVVQIEAGIARGLALEDELVVATERPAAVQCIRWAGPDPGGQTRTELLGKLPWMTRRSSVVELVYDRAMSLFIWIAADGCAYAVQRLPDAEDRKPAEGQGRHFRGFPLHVPEDEGTQARRAAINARFSLLAIGCASGQVYVYIAKDYAGSLPLSHKLEPPASLATTGAIAVMAFSPDGYCLFLGYEKGWVIWSVYGKMCGNSFAGDPAIAKENNEDWLTSIYDASWISGGAEIVLVSQNGRRMWVMDLARDAIAGCFGPANVSRMLLIMESELLMYRGHDLANILSLPSEDQWDRVPMPPLFLQNQRPIRCAVTSPDGRYVAVAGRRGLAHYSVQSGRWKTFDDVDAESAFVLRGGMLWYQYILIASVDVGDYDEVKSRRRKRHPRLRWSRC